MPFGLQVIGRFRGDVALLGAASAMEQAFASDARLRRPRPDLTRLQPAQPALTSIVTAAPDNALAHTPSESQAQSVV
jgi:hypothetical protein